MVAIESKDDLYVIDLLEDFDEFYLELEKFAEENRVPIIDKIGIRFLIQMLKVKKAKNLLEIGTAIGYTSIKLAERIGCNVTTIERDDKMYKEAKNNISKTDNIEGFVIRPIDSFSFEYGKYVRKFVKSDFESIRESKEKNKFKENWNY